MIELFLSTDGKHTVHVSADSPEQLMALVPKAKALYQEVLTEFGAKRQVSPAPYNGNGTQYGGNGHAKVGKRIDTVAEAQAAVTPHCPLHQASMRYRQGRMGPFWSCPTRKPDGRWCQVTQEVSAVGNGQASAA